VWEREGENVRERNVGAPKRKFSILGLGPNGLALLVATNGMGLWPHTTWKWFF
jgi:hypothetical protein